MSMQQQQPQLRDKQQCEDVDVLVINEKYDDDDDEDRVDEALIVLSSVLHSSNSDDDDAIPIDVSPTDNGISDDKGGNADDDDRNEEEKKLQQLLGFDYYTSTIVRDASSNRYDANFLAADAVTASDNSTNTKRDPRDDNNDETASMTRVTDECASASEEDDDDDDVTVTIDSDVLNGGSSEIDKLLMRCEESNWELPPHKMKHYILINVKDILIPIDTRDTVLSVPMQHTIWSTPCRRERFRYPVSRLLNARLSKMYKSAQHGHTDDECVGYFAAVYDNQVNKNMSQFKQRDPPNGAMSICVERAMTERSRDGKLVEFSSRTSGDGAALSTNNVSRRVDDKLKFYREFALIIVQNGSIRDAAVHGYKNNISDILDEYDVRTIYINCDVGSSLDTFLSYKYQPFYQALHSRNLIYMHGVLRNNINTITHCNRGNIFCAFCRCINTIVKHYTIKRINIRSAQNTRKSLIDNFQKMNSTRDNATRNDDGDSPATRTLTSDVTPTTVRGGNALSRSNSRKSDDCDAVIGAENVESDRSKATCVVMPTVGRSNLSIRRTAAKRVENNRDNDDDAQQGRQPSTVNVIDEQQRDENRNDHEEDTDDEEYYRSKKLRSKIVIPETNKRLIHATTTANQQRRHPATATTTGDVKRRGRRGGKRVRLARLMAKRKRQAAAQYRRNCSYAAAEQRQSFYDVMLPQHQYLHYPDSELLAYYHQYQHQVVHSLPTQYPYDYCYVEPTSSSLPPSSSFENQYCYRRDYYNRHDNGWDLQRVCTRSAEDARYYDF